MNARESEVDAQLDAVDEPLLTVEEYLADPGLFDAEAVRLWGVPADADEAEELRNERGAEARTETRLTPSRLEIRTHCMAMQRQWTADDRRRVGVSETAIVDRTPPRLKGLDPAPETAAWSDFLHVNGID